MFKVGDKVSYGLHGKCIVAGLEVKTVGSNEVSFYNLKTIKNPISERSTSKLSRGESMILVPVDGAEKKGLRLLLSREEGEKLFSFLSEAENELEAIASQPWLSRQKILEEMIRTEGAHGLTQVVIYLNNLMNQDAVPSSALTKFYENILKILVRELAEVLEEPLKDVEQKVQRALRIRDRN